MADEANAGVDSEAGADLEQELNEDSGAPQGQEDDTDWKAEYDKAILERDNYKTALTQKRGLRKQAPQPVVGEEELDESKPATVADIRRIVEDTTASSSADAILNELVKDPNKRALVKLNYETRIRQTGTSDASVRADIEAALDLTDAKKLRKTTAEFARIQNKDKTPPLSGSGSDRGQDAKNHKFSADQMKALEAKAAVLGVDPKKFVEQTWKNQQGR